MSAENRPPASEREQTDESLRAEREFADRVLGEDPGALDEVADAVILKARARADEVLAVARAKMDANAARSVPGAQLRDQIRRERLREDRVLQEERADADELLRVERDEHVGLLSRERVETDKDLLSERQRADHSLATRDEFLGIVSHDLRNMLGVIMGFAKRIEKGVKAESHLEQVLGHAQLIQRSGARMSRLIGDLVDVASIEAGMLAVTPELLDPTHVVTEAVDSFQTQASAAGVSVSVEIAQPPPRLPFDPARILQVLINLLSNALKFTPSGGKVSVRVEPSGEELCFSVSDSGTGIPPDKLEVIFERFVQITRGDRRGVGLGLYISKCIVQGHGGRIWSESILGQGSSFSFALPLHPPLARTTSGD